MSSSKLSSKRSAPRVCPAINASRANPPANNRRGEKEQERERGGLRGNSSDRVAARSWNCFVNRRRPSEGTADSWPDDRETILCASSDTWDPDFKRPRNCQQILRISVRVCLVSSRIVTFEFGFLRFSTCLKWFDEQRGLTWSLIFGFCLHVYVM